MPPCQKTGKEKLMSRNVTNPALIKINTDRHLRELLFNVNENFLK